MVVGPATPETTPRRLQRKNERGETPLHLTAIKGDFKGVSSLLRQGADVMATDHAGEMDYQVWRYVIDIHVIRDIHVA